MVLLLSKHIDLGGLIAALFCQHLDFFHKIQDGSILRVSSVLLKFNLPIS